MNREDYRLFGAQACNKRGEQVHTAKMDAEKVRYVRRNPKGMTAKQLAAQFGVHYRTIEKIQYRETWENV